MLLAVSLLSSIAQTRLGRLLRIGMVQPRVVRVTSR
jgi:hypothetical protein